MNRHIVCIFLSFGFMSFLEAGTLDEMVESIIENIGIYHEVDFQVSEKDRAVLFGEHMNFGNSFKELDQLKGQKKPWKIPFTAFFKLADCYLKHAQKFIEPNLYKKLEDYLSPHQGQLDYQSFLIFFDFLAIATTPEEKRLERENNTLYDTYQATLYDLMTDMTLQEYKRTFLKLGNAFTRKYATTNAQVYIFPNVVLVPYPYALSDTEIVLSLPTPMSSSTWLFGQNLRQSRTTEADGSDMTDMKFRAHDVVHLSIYRTMIGTWWSHEKKMVEPEIYAEEIQHYKKAKELFFLSVEVAKGLIRLANDSPEPIDAEAREGWELRQRLYPFFSFLVFHEYRSSIIQRFHWFSEGGLISDDRKESILNKKYYNPLLPESWRDLSWDKLKPLLEDHFTLYQQAFRDYAQQYFPKHNLLQGIEEILDVVKERGHFYKCLYDPSAYQSKCMLEKQEPFIKMRFLNARQAPKYGLTFYNYLIRIVINNPFIGDEKLFIEYFIMINSAGDFFCLTEPIDKSIDNMGNTLLMLACSVGKDSFKELIRASADVNKQNVFGETALTFAVFHGHLNMVLALLECGANPHDKGIDDYELFEENINWGNKTFLEGLLNSDLFFSQEVLRQATEYAFSKKKIDLARILLKKIDLNYTSSDGYTALHSAVCSRSNDLVFELIKCGSNVNFSKDGKLAPLPYAIYHENHESVDLLLKHNAQVDNLPFWILEKAFKDEKMTQQLIEAGLRPTSLFYWKVFRNNNYYLFHYFLNNGFNFSASCSLLLAISNHRKEMIQALIENGVMITHDRLNNCILNNKEDILELFLKYKPDLNTLQDKIPLPLISAVKANKVEMIKLLLSHGANPMVQQNGKTAIDVAEESGFPEIVELLKDAVVGNPPEN